MKEVKKPWGDFKEFALNKKCTVKIIEVQPRQELSLQYHNKRKEMWYFLTSGYAKLGNKKKRVKEGEIIYVKKKQLHSAFAKNKKVKFLEISFDDFDENDIVRVEDKYGRVK